LAAAPIRPWFEPRDRELLERHPRRRDALAAGLLREDLGAGGDETKTEARTAGKQPSPRRASVIYVSPKVLPPKDQGDLADATARGPPYRLGVMQRSPHTKGEGEMKSKVTRTKWYEPPEPVAVGEVIEVAGIRCEVKSITPIPSRDPHDGNVVLRGAPRLVRPDRSQLPHLRRSSYERAVL
jgi:hypothetical protein